MKDGRVFKKISHKTLKVLSIFLAGLITFGSTQELAAQETWSWGTELRESSDQFDSGISLKRKKKVGITSSFAGAHGMAGVNIDINFTGDFGLGIGVGASRGFNSFNLNVKQTLGGTTFLPYFTGGYSRWYNNSEEEVSKTSPGFFAKEFLSAKERATGKFAENIFYPGFGIQYLNISGDWSGFGTFFELLYLVDIDDFQAALTAGVGATLYF